MYCFVYRFKVHEGQEERFIQAWSEVTEAFVDFCGGLGSRLHLHDEREYITYAQWPSKQAREEASLPLPIKNGPLAEMQSCCESIETLFELTPVADLLVPSEIT